MDFDLMMDRLRGHYRSGTHKGDPFHVLVRTVISQRTKDQVTDAAAARLLNKYPTPISLANADEDDIDRLIYPAGFHRVKSKQLKAIARELVEGYDSIVPDTMDGLLELPLVGRKTANCVLVFAFDKDALPVDTHVHRISNRMGIVSTQTPERSEQELKKVVPRKYWKEINELLVSHGKTICRPISPRCGECFLQDLCPKLV